MRRLRSPYVLGAHTHATATEGGQLNPSVALTTVPYLPGGTDVAVADGGTGASTAQAAINTLSAVSAATNEHVLTKDTATGNATFKAPAGGGGTPGGSNTQLQRNNAGAFGGISGATSDGTTVTLTSPTLVTPALGTPSALVLTNATGLPTAGLVDDAVTYAKMQNVSATDKLLGRSTSGSGNVEEITCTSFIRTMLDDADGNAVKTTLGIPAAGDVELGRGLPFALDNWSSATPATPTLLANGRQALKFPDSGTTVAILEGEVPPNFVGTGTIKLKLDWVSSATSGNNIRWLVATEFIAVNTSMAADSFGSDTATVVSDSTTANGRATVTITISSHGGTPSAGAPWRIKLQRTPGDASDNLGTDVTLVRTFFFEDN